MATELGWHETVFAKLGEAVLGAGTGTATRPMTESAGPVPV